MKAPPRRTQGDWHVSSIPYPEQFYRSCCLSNPTTLISLVTLHFNPHLAVTSASRNSFSTSQLAFDILYALQAMCCVCYNLGGHRRFSLSQGGLKEKNRGQKTI